MYIYIALAIQTIVIVYLIIKIRQPVVLTRTRKNPRDDIPDLSDLGDILQEVKPEIIRNLKLNKDQIKILDTWIQTIDVASKSKIAKWLLNKIGRWT